MSSYKLFLISYSSVLIPFLTSIFLFKKIERKHYPFLYFVWLVSAADLSSLLSILFLKKSGFWIIIINVNVLCEALLLTWMFRKWGIFFQKSSLYIILQTLFLFFWFIEVSYFSNPFKENLYFPIFYNFICALLTITMVNRLTRVTGKPLYDDPRLFICTGLLIYLLGELLPLVLAMDFFEMSRFFRRRMLNLADIFVTLMYLIFTYSLILMAKKGRARIRKETFSTSLESINRDIN
jgi:hypothetical protein